ncbi:unnamed protein product [Vicia faba]|uniref:Uncharacterized protein n=1 Tax=Vicia faba TaxID=3906 RepID=A0AAV0YQB3_VICFA|nr:unnamed protein product [Vicia faba]
MESVAYREEEQHTILPSLPLRLLPFQAVSDILPDTFEVTADLTFRPQPGQIMNYVVKYLMNKEMSLSKGEVGRISPQRNPHRNWKQRCKLAIHTSLELRKKVKIRREVEE